MWQLIYRYLSLTDYKASLVTNDLKSRLQARLFQLATFAFLVIYIVYMTFVSIYAKRTWPTSHSYYIIHFLFFSGFINYFLLNKHKNATIAYAYNILLYVMILHLLSYNSGGIRNSGNAFLLAIILNAFILVGKKFGLFVTFLSISNLFYFYFITVNTKWIDYSYFRNNEATVHQDYLITLTIAILCIWFQAKFLQKINNDTIANINERNKEILATQAKAQQLNQAKVENELKALRSQMNPHFSYNIMNSINYFLSKNDTEKAQYYLNKFSGLMRKLLDNSLQDIIPLADEINLLEQYCELEQIRFTQKFLLDIAVADAINIHIWKLPSMLLQPFVENSIKHGFDTNAVGNRLTISFTNNPTDELVCTITDNGIGLTKAQALKAKTTNTTTHKSHGLDITRERLKLYKEQYNQVADVTITDGENGIGTKAVIRLPIITDQNMNKTDS